MATIPFSRHAAPRSPSAPASHLFESAGRVADRLLLAMAPYFFRYARQRRAHWRQSVIAVAAAFIFVGIWLFALRAL